MSNHDKDKINLEKSAESKRPLGRREALSWGTVGLMGVLLQACSNTNFKGFTKAVKRTAGDRDADGGAGAPRGETAAGPLDTSCSAVSTNKIDVSAIPSLPAEHSPTLKFYGNASTTSLLAIKLKAPNTTQFVITSVEGRVLALHVLTEADKSPTGGFRPITVEGLYLSGYDRLKIISTVDGSEFSSEHEVNYFRTHKGLPVVDLSQQSVPQGFLPHQTVPLFADASGFNKSNTWFYPNLSPGAPQRPLYSAQQGAKWTDLGSLKGEVMDIMGEAVPVIDLIENQTLCTYVLGDDKKYYRTVFKIG